MMGALQQISDSELLLMRMIWGRGGKALFAELMEELEHTNNDWKANTVLTFLSRLVEKGYLSVKKHGRRNEYLACVTEERYASCQTERFLERVYEGNAKGLLNTLLSAKHISEKDMEELLAFWNERRGEE